MYLSPCMGYALAMTSSECTQLYLDTEFTGLHQNTSLISLGLCDDQDRTFYAEFTDYRQDQVDQWIQQNVLSKTRWLSDSEWPEAPFSEVTKNSTECVGNSEYVVSQLIPWLEHYPNIEIWGDCLAWDWVLFCELFGGAFGLPKHIHYMPRDLVTLLHQHELDVDLDRFAYVEQDSDKNQHNALADARVLRAMVNQLSERGDNCRSNEG